MMWAVTWLPAYNRQRCERGHIKSLVDAIGPLGAIVTVLLQLSLGTDSVHPNLHRRI